MKLILHGLFAQDYGTAVEIKATTAAEAIEGFSRQVDFYGERVLDERPVVRVIGFDTKEKLEADISDDTVLHLVPAMYGGGGSFGKILIGAALIGLAFVPGVGTAISLNLAAVGLGTVTSGAILFGLGASLILTGVMGLFMKAPSLSKDKDPEASKYLGGASITTEIGTVWPYCLGTVKLGGYLLSYDVTSNSLSYGTFPASIT